MRNRLDFVDREHAQTGQPTMNAEQRVVIGAGVSRRWLSGDGTIEHAIETRSVQKWERYPSQRRAVPVPTLLNGPIKQRRRLGGLLEYYYHREAAWLLAILFLDNTGSVDFGTTGYKPSPLGGIVSDTVPSKGQSLSEKW
jgi:hypothetical protein